MTQSRKVGAIVALCGSILALFAFFALPLFVFGLFSVTAQQIASSSFNTGYGYNTGYGSSSSQSWSWLWIAAVLALVVCLLALVPLFSKGSTAPPPVHNPEDTQYQASYPPTPATGYTQMKSSGEVRAASAGIVICSVISIIVVIVSYTYLSQQGNAGISISATSFLGTGFWLYAIGAITELVGGIMQIQA